MPGLRRARLAHGYRCKERLVAHTPLHAEAASISSSECTYWASLRLSALPTCPRAPPHLVPRRRNPQVRKGMVLVDERLKPAASWEFDADIAILTHSTTIQPRYQVGAVWRSCCAAPVFRTVACKTVCVA